MLRLKRRLIKLLPWFTKRKLFRLLLASTMIATVHLGMQNLYLSYRLSPQHETDLGRSEPPLPKGTRAVEVATVKLPAFLQQTEQERLYGVPVLYSQREKASETPTRFPWKAMKVKDVDCKKLFAGDPNELKKALAIQNSTLVSLEPKEITRKARNCRQFRRDFGFITDSLTKEERHFPIAYSILLHKQAEQVLNLLRAIYRPQNYYCLHVDLKTAEDVQQAIKAVANCFHNVFLASRSLNVTWGQFSVLEPELICMQDLWSHKDWRYFINLTGQEFPLRTNHELVKILTAYNGMNDVDGTQRTGKWRWPKKNPHGLRLVKGNLHIAVNRDFVDYILHNPFAKIFLQWTKKHVRVPDETYFATLNHNPHLGIRGSYLGDVESHPVLKPYNTRFKNWRKFPFNFTCHSGTVVRQICILSVADLPLLNVRPEMFANKFFRKFSRFALECLAERLYNRTRDEFLGTLQFDASYYGSLPQVKHMVRDRDDFWRVYRPVYNDSVPK